MEKNRVEVQDNSNTRHKTKARKLSLTLREDCAFKRAEAPTRDPPLTLSCSLTVKEALCDSANIAT